MGKGSSGAKAATGHRSARTSFSRGGQPAPGRGTESRLSRSASVRIDRALSRSPGAKDNNVTLADLRKRLPGSRVAQDALIRRAQVAGTHSLDSFEGHTYRDLTPAHLARARSIREAGISTKGGLLTHISRRGDSPLAPVSGTGKGKRRR
jgi:hypothetical protein